MEWQFIVALVVMIPVILFPAAFVWYLNFGGLVGLLKGVKLGVKRVLSLGVKV